MSAKTCIINWADGVNWISHRASYPSKRQILSFFTVANLPHSSTKFINLIMFFLFHFLSDAAPQLVSRLIPLQKLKIQVIKASICFTISCVVCAAVKENPIVERPWLTSRLVTVTRKRAGGYCSVVTQLWDGIVKVEMAPSLTSLIPESAQH